MKSREDLRRRQMSRGRPGWRALPFPPPPLTAAGYIRRPHRHNLLPRVVGSVPPLAAHPPQGGEGKPPDGGKDEDENLGGEVGQQRRRRGRGRRAGGGSRHRGSRPRRAEVHTPCSGRATGPAPVHDRQGRRGGRSRGVRIVTVEGRKGGGKGLRQEGAAEVRHAGTRASGGGSGNGEKGRGGGSATGFSGREQAGDEVGVEDERSQTASRLNSGRGGWRG